MTKMYDVELEFIEVLRETEKFEVEAKNEKEALELAKKQSWNCNHEIGCELVDWFVKERIGYVKPSIWDWKGKHNEN